MSGFFTYRRPHVGRIVVAFAYMLGTAGLLVLAWDAVLLDRWGITGAAVGTLALLGLILYTGRGGLWLGVGGCWIYAAVIEAFRGASTDERTGLSLVFLALAFGALAAYVAYRREAPLRV